MSGHACRASAAAQSGDIAASPDDASSTEVRRFPKTDPPAPPAYGSLQDRGYWRLPGTICARYRPTAIEARNNSRSDAACGLLAKSGEKPSQQTRQHDARSLQDSRCLDTAGCDSPERLAGAHRRPRPVTKFCRSRVRLLQCGDDSTADLRHFELNEANQRTRGL